jgi:serine/threonine protein kinase
MRNYDPEKLANSRREFDLIKSIPAHPNIIRAIEFIATDRWTYTVLELAKGQELQDFVMNTPMSRQIIKSIIG